MAGVRAKMTFGCVMLATYKWREATVAAIRLKNTLDAHHAPCIVLAGRHRQTRASWSNYACGCQPDLLSSHPHQHGVSRQEVEEIHSSASHTRFTLEPLLQVASINDCECPHGPTPRRSLTMPNELELKI